MKYIGLFDEKEDIVTKEKLEAVASRVSTNEDNIAMAESDIEGLQTTVNTLQTNVTNVQTALASKQDTVVGGASTITEDNLTASRALVSNSSGKVAVSTVTSTELGYLDGVTSNVQTQLNDKQPTITVNGIIKGDGAGNLSAQDTVAAELVDLPTVPTKVSELTNDANYITSSQAPVQSVNNKTGTVSLTASDVSAIPSTLTGTAGQVLTKTADGQEWKDAASPQPSTTTPLAPTEAGSVGTSTEYARGDHSHPSEVFWCTVTSDVMSEEYSCDKTYAEIVAAYNAGKICIAKYGGIVFQLANVKLLGLGTKYVKFRSSVSSSSVQNSSSSVVVFTITSRNTVTREEEIVSRLPDATKITLTVAGWDSTAKTQSVAVSGVSADATKQEIRVMPVNAALDSPYIAAGVQCVAQAANSLTFGCETVPTEAIDVYVVMQDVSYSA